MLRRARGTNCRAVQGDPPVVCFAGQDWAIHGPAHCDFQIMRQLGKRQVALVVNGIGMRLPLRGRTERPWRRVARKVSVTVRYFLRRPARTSPHLWVMTPLSFPAFGSPSLRRLNARLVAAQVWLVSRALGMRDPWALTTLPTWVDVVEALGWGDRVVYYRPDDHAQQPDVDVELIRSFEDRLIERAHVVLYASHWLQAREQHRSGRKAMFLDHGVETDHFVPSARAVDPPDLAPIPHPRVGFFGQIDATSVDLDLVARLARELPDVAVVMIGRSATDLARFADNPNVHLLGFRAYESLPAYAHGFDVAIVPLPRSDWIDAANPIKLKEYLSVGLPVVAMGNDEMERFRDHVALCATHEEFVDAVRHALETQPTGAAEARRGSVLASGWDRRAEEVAGVIRSLARRG